MSKTKSLALILGVLIMSFLVGYLIFAWTEPTQAPPAGNVTEPLNRSSNPQDKPARLTFTEFYDYNNTNYYINPDGQSVLAGNVGIGTTSPGALLHLYSTTAANDNPQLILENYPGSGSYSTSILFKGVSSTSPTVKRSVAKIYSGFTTGAAWADANIHFQTPNSGGTLTDRIVIRGNSGNVGIGTTGPNQKLSVAGTLGVIEGGASPTYYSIFQGGDQSANITYTLPTAQGGANTVLTNNGTGVLSWAAAGGGLPSGTSGQTLRHDGTSWVANSLLFNNGTNVGIGTTGPGYKLDVNGDIRLSGSGLYNSAGYKILQGNATDWLRINDAQQFPAIALYKPVAIGTGGLAVGEWSQQSSGVLKVTQSAYLATAGGNVGIGDTTPASLFTVGSGDLFQVDSSGNLIKIRGVTYSWPAVQGGANTFLQNNGSGTLSWAAAGGAGLWTDQGTYIYPNNYTDFVITDTGNVGIGTTAPGDTLHVNSSSYRMTVNNSGDADGIGSMWGTFSSVGQVRNPGFTFAGGTLGLTNIMNSDFAFFGMTGSNDDSNAIINWGDDNNLLFAYNGSTLGTWQGNGNVGIGTTSPGAKLEVDDSTKAVIMTQSLYGAEMSGSASGRGIFGSNLYVDAANNLKTAGSHASYGYSGMEAAWGSLKFYTQSGATTGDATVTPTARMTIDTSGNVGTSGNLTVGGKTNIVNPLTTWETWNKVDWNNGQCLSFTPAQASSYSAMTLMVSADRYSDVMNYEFYTTSDCSSGQVGTSIKIPFYTSGAVTCGLSTYYNRNGVWLTLTLPTSVRGIKMITGGCTALIEQNPNVILTTYFR